MRNEVKLEIRGWSAADNRTLKSRKDDLLVLARARSVDLTGMTDHDPLVTLMRWARLEVFRDLDWDLAQKIEGGERLAYWVLDKLHMEGVAQKAQGCDRSRTGETVASTGHKRRGAPRKPARQFDAKLAARMYFEDGLDTAEVGRKLGFPRAEVARGLRIAGYTLRQAGVKPKDWHSDPETLEIAELYRSGMGLVRIGRRYGMRPMGVRDRLLKIGVEMRPKGVLACKEEK